MIAIKNNPGYFVDCEGRVWSEKSKKFLVPRPGKNKYLRVSLSGQRDFYVHRLVAGAFLSNPKKKKYVNHKNGNVGDNSLSNLEWVTAKENTRHMVEVLKKNIGEKTGHAKLTNDQVINIKSELGLPRCSVTKLAEQFNVSRKAICNIKHGRSWRGVE